MAVENQVNNLTASKAGSAEINAFSLRDMLLSIHQGSTGFRPGNSKYHIYSNARQVFSLNLELKYVMLS
jgi:hypothetical protein